MGIHDNVCLVMLQAVFDKRQPRGSKEETLNVAEYRRLQTRKVGT